jgi:hypothetical protein
MPDGKTWTTADDHSKWCIGQSTQWVCVGDINRQHGQFSRGGSELMSCVCVRVCVRCDVCLRAHRSILHVRRWPVARVQGDHRRRAGVHVSACEMASIAATDTHTHTQ